MRIVAGREDLELEALSLVTEELKADFQVYMETVAFSVRQAESSRLLDMTVQVYREDSYAVVRIADTHTNIVHIEKDGKILLHKETGEQTRQDIPDYSLLTVQGIYDFAQSVDMNAIQPVLEKQILYNTAISA